MPQSARVVEKAKSCIFSPPSEREGDRDSGGGRVRKKKPQLLTRLRFLFCLVFLQPFLAAFGVKICGRNFAAKKTERDNDKNVLTEAKNALMKAPKGFDGAAKTPRGRAPKEPRGAPTRVGQPNTLREPKTPRESLKSPLQKAFKRSTCEQISLRG